MAGTDVNHRIALSKKTTPTSNLPWRHCTSASFIDIHAYNAKLIVVILNFYSLLERA